MIRKEILHELRKDLKKNGVNSPKEETEIIFDSVIRVLTDAITSGQDVIINNFGTFSSEFRESRNISKYIKESVTEMVRCFVIKFKPATHLKNKINGKIK